MSKTALNVRLMDGDNALHPETMVDDLIKTFSYDEDDIAHVVKFVPVEHQIGDTGNTYLYSTFNGTDSLKRVSPAALQAAIPIYGAGGVLAAGSPTTNDHAVNLQYANNNFAGLTGGNALTGDQTINGTVKITTLIDNVVNALYVSGDRNIFVSKSASGSSTPTSTHTIAIPYADGTLALISDVTSGDATTLTSAKSYTDTQIAANISSVLTYKGSVETYADLPTSGNKIGDVWNVVEAYGEVAAGTNWAWNGTTWDPLGGTVDMSDYVEHSELEAGGDYDLTLKLDKLTTTGTSVYSHTGETQSEIYASVLQTANSLALRGSLGELYSDGIVTTGMMSIDTDEGLVLLEDISFNSSTTYGLRGLVCASDLETVVDASENSIEVAKAAANAFTLTQVGTKLDKASSTDLPVVSTNYAYCAMKNSDGTIDTKSMVLVEQAGIVTNQAIVRRNANGHIVLPDYTAYPPSGNFAVSANYLNSKLNSLTNITYEEV